MKIDFLKKDSYENRGHILGWGSGPDADWNVMFKTFIALLFIVFVLGVLMFINVGVGSFGSDLDSEMAPPIDEINLKHVVLDYSDIEATFNKLKTTISTTPDPSI